MALNNGRITAPISIDDVRNALGETSNDLGTLCRSGNINMWSRKKPVEHGSMTSITNDENKSVNFGLTLQTIHPGDVPADKASEKYRFYPIYTPPIKLFRLTDFENYDQYAVHPIKELRVGNEKGGKKPVIVPSQYLGKYTQKYTASLVFNRNSGIGINELSANTGNIGSIGDLYLTLVIGANMGSLSTTESRIWQSRETLAEAYNSGKSEMYVEADTSRLLADNVLITRDNIVFVYLAQKKTADHSFPHGVSLKMKPNTNNANCPAIETTYYNDNYARYGDGGEGGSLPKKQIEAYIELASSWNPSYSIETGSDGRNYMTINGAYAVVHVTKGGAPLTIHSGMNVRAGSASIGDRVSDDQSGSGTGSYYFIDGTQENQGMLGIRIEMSRIAWARPTMARVSMYANISSNEPIDVNPPSGKSLETPGIEIDLSRINWDYYNQ